MLGTFNQAQEAEEIHPLELHFPETTQLTLGTLRKWIYTKNELIKLRYSGR